MNNTNMDKTSEITDSHHYEKRLYFFVPYNLSPIQQGIQAGHAALEYASMYGNDPAYLDFMTHWKTWIILNGGTTNSQPHSSNPDIPIGSLDKIEKILLDNHIKHAVFREPDLNNALTAVCILLDERVFKWAALQDFSEEVLILRELISDKKLA
jgi:hypothetical protein